MLRHPMPYPTLSPESPMSLLVRDVASQAEEALSPDELPDPL